MAGRVRKSGNTMAGQRTTKVGEELFVAARKAWDKGDEHSAFNLFTQSVAAGYAGAEQNLGYCYDEGIGVRKNFPKALYWYKTAWRHGSVSAASNLAMAYATRGNRRQAMYWWRNAVGQGDGDAALDLAKLYRASSHHAAAAKAKTLLQRALGSKYITPAGREEALALAMEMGL